MTEPLCQQLKEDLYVSRGGHDRTRLRTTSNNSNTSLAFFVFDTFYFITTLATAALHLFYLQSKFDFRVMIKVGSREVTDLALYLFYR